MAVAGGAGCLLELVALQLGDGSMFFSSSVGTGVLASPLLEQLKLP